MKTISKAVLAGVSFMLLFAVAQHAQQIEAATLPASSIAPRENRVVVLRVADIGSTATRAVVIRRPGIGTSNDFIVVDATTTPRDLAKAVAVLMFSRRTQGAQVGRELRAEIAAADSTLLASKDVERAAKDLARLGKAKVASVAGIGKGPVVGITTASVKAKKK